MPPEETIQAAINAFHLVNPTHVRDPQLCASGVRAAIEAVYQDLVVAAVKAATGSVTRDETREERLWRETEEYADLTGRMGRLLTLTANALKGEPPELTMHDWSDLPDVAGRLVRENGRLRNGLAPALAEQVKERRIELGMSFAQLAKKAGISKGYLWAIENPKDGKGTRPGYDTVEKLMGALGMIDGEINRSSVPSTRSEDSASGTESDQTQENS